MHSWEFYSILTAEQIFLLGLILSVETNLILYSVLATVDLHPWSYPFMLTSRSPSLLITCFPMPREWLKVSMSMQGSYLFSHSLFKHHWQSPQPLCFFCVLLWLQCHPRLINAAILSHTTCQNFSIKARAHLDTNTVFLLHLCSQPIFTWKRRERVIGPVRFCGLRVNFSCSWEQLNAFGDKKLPEHNTGWVDKKKETEQGTSRPQRGSSQEQLAALAIVGWLISRHQRGLHRIWCL